MNAFVAMDLDRFIGGLTDDVVAFEFDLENKPVRLESQTEVARWAGMMFAELKRMNATMKLDVQKISCQSGSAFAYCTVEFNFSMVMGDGSTMTQPTRNTVALRKSGGVWKWAHWHSSPSAAPAH